MCSPNSVYGNNNYSQQNIYKPPKSSKHISATQATLHIPPTATTIATTTAVPTTVSTATATSMHKRKTKEIYAKREGYGSYGMDISSGYVVNGNEHVTCKGKKTRNDVNNGIILIDFVAIMKV